MSSNNFIFNSGINLLDYYRSLASFDWKQMKIYFEKIENIQYAEEIIKKLKSNPNLNPLITTNTLDETRYLAVKRVIALAKLNLLKTNLNISESSKSRVLLRTMIHWDMGTYAKYTLSYSLCIEVLTSLGTNDHLQYIEETKSGKAVGCFCLTEISHGSNVKAMRTTANYDSLTEEFILNTPDFESAKCWIGNLANTATYAIVYAQLYIKEVCYGLHQFVVEIRDKQTFETFPGLTIADLGLKAGLNENDNGLIIFNNYRIPRKALLNKFADVTPDGVYKKKIKDNAKILGITLGALSSGRVAIIQIGTSHLEKAITLALRYALQKLQVNTKNGEYIPMIEFQTTKYNLFPRLASCYVLKYFSIYFSEVYSKFKSDSINNANKNELAELGMEIHVLTSAGKSLSSWIGRNGIRECMSVCGKFGIHKEFVDIKNDNDPNCTFEGESNVLIQQTSNWLLKFWPIILNNGKIKPTPLNSIHFLNDSFKILGNKFNLVTIEDAINLKNIINTYQWLVCYLLKISYEKMKILKQQGIDNFTAKNNSQVFYLRTLAICYIELFMIQKMLEYVHSIPINFQKIFSKLSTLYGLWSLQNHLSILYGGGYAEGPNLAKFIQEGILKICDELTPEIAALVDVIAPDDFLIQASLAKFNGEVSNSDGSKCKL